MGKDKNKNAQFHYDRNVESGVKKFPQNPSEDQRYKLEELIKKDKDK